MTDEWTRLIIIVFVFAGFIGLMLIVLMGAITVESPELAKLVGAIFGYLTGLMTPIVTRYFRNGGVP